MELNINIHDNDKIIIAVEETDNSQVDNSTYEIVADECDCDLHIDVEEAIAQYNQSITVLEALDAKAETRWSEEEHMAWDKTVAVYQVLHKVLGIPTQPRWVD